MTTSSLRRFAAFVVCGTLLATVARAEDRKAEAILEEIKGLKNPTITREQAQNQSAVVEYVTKMREVAAKRAELVAELQKVDPKHPELAKLLPMRWSSLMQSPTTIDQAAKELDEFVATSKDEKLVSEAKYARVMLEYNRNRGNIEATMPAIEKFIKDNPKDPRGANLLMTVAMRTQDEAKQAEIYKTIAKQYAGTPAAERVKGSLRQLDGVGKPFELEFTDAIKGSQVSIKGLKGKVVVIDFWATWCGPCIAEMPKMKNLYAEFKEKGVEFIGVSLDQPKEQGGYDKLKKYVEENKIEWPQYYQGNFWDSEFSRSWGINAIPCVFLVDQEGKLHSVKARGKLETMIPELLEKGKKSPKAE